MKMKVVIVAGGAALFGKETIALELGDGLRASGVDVIFVSSLWCGDGAFGKRLQQLGIPAHFMRLGFISASLRLDCTWWTLDQLLHWPGLMLDFARLLRRENPPHIIHTNWHHLLLLLPLLDPRRDLFWLHESIPDKPQYRRVFGWLARRLRGFVPVSHAVAESLRQIGIPATKIQVIHNGLSDPSSGLPARPAGGGEVNIGIVGQVGAWKGHEDLVAAFALLAVRHPEARLHIFGPDQREFADHLKRRAAGLGIAAHLVWHGFVGERARIYRTMDICAVPSRFAEPFGLVAVEAAFFGLPVVATRKGGLPEIVEDGVTGYLVEAERPPELARRLGELLRSVDLRRQMGAAARQRAQQCFSRERLVGDFLRCLDAGTKLPQPSNQ